MAAAQSIVSFPALGSVAFVVVSDSSQLDMARAAVQRTVDEFDLACSRFRDDSELSAVNAAAGRPVRVGRLLIEAVLEALRAARLTDGDVDPTVGQSLVALGYDRDFGELYKPAARARSIRIVPIPGWQSVEVDEDALTVRVPAGVRLDLGATAKALAADRAAAAAVRATGGGVLVALGGDISIAGGSSPDGWRVRVTDDHRASLDAPGQWLSLQSGGLATSSTTVRRWQVGAESAHHLVDPSTGRPLSTPWRTASVCAVNCLDANIAATAAMVRGEHAVQWLRSLELPSRLVDVDGGVRHLAGWPSTGDDLAPDDHLASDRDPAPACAGSMTER